MKVYKFNDVFAHIEKTLFERYGDNSEYDKVLFVLGYNVLKLKKQMRLQSNMIYLIIMCRCMNGISSPFQSVDSMSIGVTIKKASIQEQNNTRIIFGSDTQALYGWILT